MGLNSRLDALQAAVLRIKLQHLNNWTKARQENAARYAALFQHYELLDAVALPKVLPDRRHVFNQYTVRIRGRRDEVIRNLHERKIGAAIYYPRPLHLQKCFADLGYHEGDLPAAEAAAREVLSLPIYPELRADAQETVVRGIARTLAANSKSGTVILPAPVFLKHDAARAA